MSAQLSIFDSAPGEIHAAHLEQSDRLQRVLRYMMDGSQRTTMDIICGARVTNAPTAICELEHKKNGYKFDRYVDYKDGKMIQWYWLLDIEKARVFFENRK